MRSRQPGIALVMVIVVLMLIELMSAGMLAMATHSRLVVDSQMRTTRADAAAVSAVRTVLGQWETSSFDTMGVGRVAPVPSASGSALDAMWSVKVERLSGAAWLIRSQSRVGDGHAYSIGRAIAIVRTLDAVLARADAPTDSVAVGGLTWSQVEGIADRSFAGTVSLSDSAGEAPLTYARGDLTLEAGSGRGILVVKGRLTIRAYADFDGLIVANGEVALETGSVVSGAVRSAAGPVLGDASGVLPSDDVVREVLEASPARQRVVSEVRRYIPAFQGTERS